MTDALLVVSLLVSLAGIGLLITLLVRKPAAGISVPLENRLALLEKGLERLEKAVRDEIARNREEAGLTAKQGREEQNAAFSHFTKTVLANVGEMATQMSNGLQSANQNTIAAIGELSTQQKHLLDGFAKQLNELTQMNERKLESIRGTVEQKLAALQEDNSKKLEQMRVTVDEKLHATLEQRLGESFKLVSERLEQVHNGLGEMKNLASGVGDLKKVLSNVKTRGILGEIQLENLLEQILTVEQYEKNVATRPNSGDRVEFAVKLPGPDGDRSQVWLPIDSKFPLEDYQRLLDAQEEGNLQALNDAAKQLEARIRLEAKSIREKYIEPPHTTDFAIMFLPIEGLFAEVLRKSGLWESLQKEYRVVITGPTTLTALLNSLQMGFRTLAIQKRSGEVWQLLGAVKTEFGKFGDVLEKTQKKLQEASKTIDTAAVRTRAIERKLRTVEELPTAEATRLLPDMERLEADADELNAVGMD
ncbi:DNA recombination protein RmuC [Effusibacillus dendaii]|uniref:DNA recombination protein RmuC n=1 Tax=Effusibacillus dendaii TaxID=2743772 RepID=A0A7I8D9F9_9BACL|nr:DNA recombination protein RmuC [Effusibacillus dendaii]BCJ86754.1 DNA recombination protein RmuC [Effusibacillus dendaii]